MQQNAETHRIEIGGAGFGEASDETIEQRARDIARADGRDAAEDRDRAAAFAELRAPLASATEGDIHLTEANRPDAGVPPTSTGSQAPTIEAEDEETLAESLVQEGIEEADRDVRTRAGESAADDTFESGSR